MTFLAFPLDEYLNVEFCSKPRATTGCFAEWTLAVERNYKIINKTKSTYEWTVNNTHGFLRWRNLHVAIDYSWREVCYIYFFWYRGYVFYMYHWQFFLIWVFCLSEKLRASIKKGRKKKRRPWTTLRNTRTAFLRPLSVELASKYSSNPIFARFSPQVTATCFNIGKTLPRYSFSGRFSVKAGINDRRALARRYIKCICN